MSGQYPSGFPNQQNFTNQMNPMRNQIMNMGLSNQMGLMNYNQSSMIHQQHQSQNIQSNNLGMMSQSNLSSVGMPSPSHISQQQSQVAQQLQQTSQMGMQTSNSVNVPSLITSHQNIGQQQGHIQQQQQQQHQQQQQPLQQKEFNIVSLCRFGQETVQDILSRFQEVFAALKSVQPPNTNNPMQTASATTEKKVTEQFRTIRLLFKRLRLLFDKCNDSCQQDLGMEYTHIESLIPLKDEPDHKPEPAPSEEYKKHLQENRELIEAVMNKNKQLREVIDRIRIIIWEINTMLSMRRS